MVWFMKYSILLRNIYNIYIFFSLISFSFGFVWKRVWDRAEYHGIINETNEGSFNLFTVALSLNKYTPPIYLDTFFFKVELEPSLNRICTFFSHFNGIGVCFCFYIRHWVFKLYELLRPDVHIILDYHFYKNDQIYFYDGYALTKSMDAYILKHTQFYMCIVCMLIQRN